MRFDNKVVIVTGAASGIGRSIAISMVSEGAKLLFTDINSSGGLKTLKMIEEQGGEAKFIPADLTKSGDVLKVVNECLNNYGGIDVLINSAGLFEFGNVADCEESLWDRIIDVNLRSVYLMSKYVVPHMLKKKQGSIVNIASVGALVGVENASAYAAAKGGVVQLSKSMALDYGKENLRVNCVCPGSIETPMLRKIWEVEGKGKPLEVVREEYKKGRPLQKIGEPIDIANAVLYLASDEARFVTGTCLVVDGGITVA